jgi:hypothetical protein
MLEYPCEAVGQQTLISGDVAVLLFAPRLLYFNLMDYISDIFTHSLLLLLLPLLQIPAFGCSVFAGHYKPLRAAAANNHKTAIAWSSNFWKMAYVTTSCLDESVLQRAVFGTCLALEAFGFVLAA